MCLFYCEPNKPASNLQQHPGVIPQPGMIQGSTPFAALDDENWPLMAPSCSLQNRGSAKSLPFWIFSEDPVQGFL